MIQYNTHNTTMNHNKILNSKEKKEIIKIIKEQWSCEWKTNLVFIMNNKNNIYLITRDIEKILDKRINIDAIGLYFGEFRHNELRLSIEGSQIIGPIAIKNTLSISDEQFASWLKGDNLSQKNLEEGAFILIKHNNDFCGTGKFKENILLNYVPKCRRLLEVNA